MKSLALSFVLLWCFPAQAQFTLDRESPGPSSRRTGLAFTEIMYNPRQLPGLSTNLTLEFIELFNSKPWEEDISGFTIAGSVAYTFPTPTLLPAMSYVVIARHPGLVLTNYGITNILGPWNGAATSRLPTDRGTVQLRNRQGAVLLTVNYMDSPPWPEAADGTGHSLGLVRPSFGEDDFRAWAESDRVGGSPGGPDPLTPDPLASVFINEWQNHSDPADWIELYNHSNDPVDMSDARLTDNPQGTNAFRIAAGVSIPPRGFLVYDQNQLGFELFAGGETIYLWNSNQTRLIDVIDFRGQSNNFSSGRWPDGGALQYGLATRTPGARNSTPMRYPVVINELMFNPVSGNNDDEYVEIYNRSGRTINLAGWEFVVGISYAFGTNTVTQAMPPGAYWLVAKNPTNLAALYPGLNTNYIFGPYGGTLANGGERVLFAAADYDMVGSVNEKLNVPISDVLYNDGGRWGNWSDGQGSSLELIDPEADVNHPSNWADSNDTGESLWTAIEWTGPVGESLGPAVNDRLIIFLQGVGECLLDEIEVRVDNGPNLVLNPGFEAGLDGWSLQGSHDFSTVENEGFAGSRSLHLRAGSRGDNQSNRILSAPLTRPVPADATTVSLRAKARWLRGSADLLLRLHGTATEAFGQMARPRRLGTPGALNSRAMGNAGPAVYEVKHAPLLPAAGQPVRVTARATDPQGVAALTLRYRVDPAPSFLGLAMRDDGAGDDVVANDGIYSAALPGQTGGEMIAFYVEARDNPGAIGTFPSNVFPPPGFTRCWPNDAVARECVVRWGEAQMPGDFATYHLWVTSANSNRWHTRDPQNNTPMDGTFAYQNGRVIYNALPLYSGSPWHRTNATAGPAGPNRVDYEMNFPDDDPLLGSTDFVLNNPGNADVFTISDLSALAEQTVYKIFEGLGLPHNHRRYIHFFVNGSQRSTAYERPGNFIFEDSQQPNGEMIEQWFPNDAGGSLFKVEDWFEFENNGFDIAANNDADLTRRTVTINGEPALTAGPYRFMFRRRSGGPPNDYALIFGLIDAVSPADDPNSATVDPDAFGTVADWEEWMRHFAVQRAVGNWDSYGWWRGKNDYLYRGALGGFRHMPWDIDYSLGLGRPAHEPLFESNDPRVRAMFNTPALVRAYWRAFDDLVNGPFQNAILDPFLDTRAGVLTSNQVNIDLDAVAAIKTYIADRRTFLQGQLATVAAPFAVDGPITFSTTNNLLVLRGTAPVAVKTINLNGTAYPITWTTPTNFLVRFVLQPGVNTLLLEGIDRFGGVVPGATLTLDVEYTGPIAEPVGVLFFSEIMFAPLTPDAQFLEIVNRSTRNFDLTGWRLDGVGLTFPKGSIVTSGETIVLARNRSAFRRAYGRIPVFATFNTSLSTNGPQVLALVRPGAMGDEVIDAVRYDVALPWPGLAPGASLQVIDLAQDNGRVSNWAVDAQALATPGGSNSVAASLPFFDPVWLNEVQLASVSGPLDNFGEAEPWVELFNSGPVPLNLDGYFLADNFTTNLVRWPFPADLTLAPGEYRLIWADGEPEETEGTNLHTNFRLRDRAQIALVRRVAGAPQVMDYLTWGMLRANMTVGCYPEGQAVFRSALFDPTPAAANTGRVPSVFLNEFMTRNTAGPYDPADLHAEDWLELYNATSSRIDLGGYYFTDDPGNPTKFRVPANGQYQIAPGGFLLVWADDEASQNRATNVDLHVNFQLSSSAGFLGLYARDGQTPLDVLSYGPQGTNVTEGRYSDGSIARYAMPRPTPGQPNAIPDYNSPPRFPVITNPVVSAGQTITLLIRANDPDGSGFTMLTYAMVSAPPGSVLFQTGFYRWIVPTNQPPGSYPITLGVTDPGLPPKSDEVTFVITVRDTNASPGTITTPRPVLHTTLTFDATLTFTIDTVPGRSYRVSVTGDLGVQDWRPLGPTFVAANAMATFTDHAPGTQRFYKVERLD